MITEVAGRLKFVDLVADLTFREEEVKTKGATGIRNTIVKIIEHRGKKDYKPAIMVVDEMGDPIKVRTRNGKDEFAVYYLAKDYVLQSDIAAYVTKQTKNALGPVVEIGKVIATKAKAATKNQDIVAGLPKVEELFEARKPKEIAIIAEIDGVVEFGKSTKTRERIRIVPEVGKSKKYEFSKKKDTIVKDGDFIRAGEPLTEGEISPHDILKIKGAKELSKFLVKEIQKVYRSQGVTINDKHVEVIVRQMLRKVQITSIGDSIFLMGENVDKFRFEDEIDKLLNAGKTPPTARNILLGISRSALTTESFISAASFQETTKVLTNAAINGKIDHLLGLKENVIMGRLIPAGTGIQNYRKLEMEIVSD
jgi:DNA-directed RNA polymerase subunit beta'